MLALGVRANFWASKWWKTQPLTKLFLSWSVVKSWNFLLKLLIAQTIHIDSKGSSGAYRVPSTQEIEVPLTQQEAGSLMLLLAGNREG